MKKIISLLFLVGCGAQDKKANDSVGNDTKPEISTNAEAEPEAKYNYPQALYIDTLVDLPECSEANTRQLIYVAEDASFRACIGDAWKVIEANTVTKTETVVEKAMPAAKDPVVGFGNWIANDIKSDIGNALSQITLSEMPNNQVKLNVTVGDAIVISEVIDIDRLPWVFSKAPYLLPPNNYPLYQVQITDWSMGGIKITVINNNPTQTWNAKLTRK